jgi:DNA-binding MarR family transcriptional regulator
LGFNETNNDDIGKQSTDDAIIKFLSKKGVVDQTEKLALARISGKLEITPEQVDMSINRLSAKNFIRKIYSQGKVGFELTPKGNATIEAIARAETARITQRLQDAIHEERKAKVRSGTVNRMKSVEEKWKDYQVPDKERMGEIQQEATMLLAAAKEMEHQKPLCHVDPQSYDQQFSQYKPQIEKLAEQNSKLSKATNNCAQIINHLQAISVDIESIKKTISKYEPIAEAKDQVNQLKTGLHKLVAVQAQLALFDKVQLLKFEELRSQLGENSRLLEKLKKPTHEFAPTKRENSAEKAVMYLSPEGPVKYTGKASGYPLAEKCSKCGVIRKSTSVDMG